VLGQADAVEPALARKRHELVGFQGAAGAQGQGVAVEVDEHAGGLPRQLHAIDFAKQVEERRHRARLRLGAPVHHGTVAIDRFCRFDMDLVQRPEPNLALDRDLRQEGDAQVGFHHFLGRFDRVELHLLLGHHPEVPEQPEDHAVVA